MNTNKKCNCGCIEAERRDLNGDMKAVEQKTIDLKKKNKRLKAEREKELMNKRKTPKISRGA